MEELKLNNEQVTSNVTADDNSDNKRTRKLSRERALYVIYRDASNAIITGLSKYCEQLDESDVELLNSVLTCLQSGVDKYDFLVFGASGLAFNDDYNKSVERDKLLARIAKLQAQLDSIK